MTDRKMIYLDDAINALEREKTYSAVYKYGYTQTDYFKQYNMGLTDGIKALNKVPSAQPEPAIPLSWIENHIAWLKSVDNSFAILTAMQISTMVKKWKGEQNDGCSQVSERKESDV